MDVARISSDSSRLKPAMTAFSAQSDSDLLRRAAAGDEDAFCAIYRRHQASIYRFALQMTGSTSQAEDVTQEVFMALIRDPSSFDAGRGTLRAFLLGIARNHVLRRFDKDRYYVPIDVEAETRPAAGEGPLDQVSRDEVIETVRRAILSLPENYREAVVLCDLQELSYAEAAVVLSCAVGTVRSRLHRGRAMLLEKLQPARQSDPGPGVKSARCFA